MNCTEQFLAKLAEQDINLSANGDKLRINAPKGLLTSELRAELAARKQEILATLSRASVQNSAISITSRDVNLPLSFAQQRLWFIDQLEPDSIAYNLEGAHRFQGVLNLNALQASLNKVVERHEALRTVFTQHEGKPIQVIQPHETIRVALSRCVEFGRTTANRSQSY